MPSGVCCRRTDAAAVEYEFQKARDRAVERMLRVRSQGLRTPDVLREPLENSASEP